MYWFSAYTISICTVIIILLFKGSAHCLFIKRQYVILCIMQFFAAPLGISVLLVNDTNFIRMSLNVCEYQYIYAHAIPAHMSTAQPTKNKMHDFFSQNTFYRQSPHAL